LHVLGLLVAEAEAVTAKAELDRIAQRRPPDDFDGGSIAKAHLQQPAAEFAFAGDGDDHPLAPNA
jgi:hypothetical protein